MAEHNSKYWDIKKTLSHNALFNFIISQRGGGKTYGCLKYCVEKYLSERRHGRTWQFVYLRRHENELKKLTIQRNGRIFKAIAKEFPEHTLKAESNTLYCNGEVMGYALQLSTYHTQKSDPMPDVQMIVFDEFIANDSRTYLRDDVTAFLEMYETVARPGTDHPEVKVFFLGNAITQVNPYFDYFNLERPYAGEFKKFGVNKDILVQDVDVPALRDAKYQTRFGQMIKGTAYADYAIENKWLLDKMEFIGKKNARCLYRMAVRYEGKWIGIWYDPEEFMHYISWDVNLQHPHKFAATTDDQQPNIGLIRTLKQFESFKFLMQCYTGGQVRYESVKLKNMFRDIMKIVNAV